MGSSSSRSSTTSSPASAPAGATNARPIAPQGSGQPPPPHPYASAGPYGAYAPAPQPYLTPEMLMYAGGPPFMVMQGGGGYPYPGGPTFFGGVPPAPMPPPPPARVEHATTVKNNVNLKKGTLRVLRDIRPGCESRLYLQFSFDANVPCAVTAFFCHQEIPAASAAPGASLASRLTPLPGRPGHCGFRTLFPKGFNQQYCQAALTLSAEQGGPTAAGVGYGYRGEWLEVRSFTTDELTATGPSNAPPQPQQQPPRGIYPIAVVIEALPDGSDGASDPALYRLAASATDKKGVVLPVAPPSPSAAVAHASASSASPNKVALQATYASLAYKPAEDARDATDRAEALASATRPAVPAIASHAWSTKTLYQRIQVGGSVYELREIFGMDGSGASAAGSSSGASAAAGGDASSSSSSSSAGDKAAEQMLASSAECVICLTDKRDTTVLPCRHMCVCHECAQQLRASTNKCPICRSPVVSLLQIKVGGGGGGGGSGGSGSGAS